MNVLIIEDEPNTAQVLSEIILQVRPNSKIVEVLDSIDRAVSYLSDQADKVDLIFADIQLADGLSFEIFSQLSVNCPIIFCTAFDEYTLRAFKANGIDYILKPIKEGDVKSAFNKYDTLKESLSPESSVVELLRKTFTSNNEFKKTLLVHYRDKFIPVEVINIALFVMTNEILYLHTFSNQRYPIFKSMAEIESSIDSSMFYRINRQIIMNRNAIREVAPYFNRKVIIKPNLDLKEQLVVSRLKVTEFMKWIEQN
jgi:DNA-binding LytR/AlgR family response regulator